ncbi:hypothetical protein [Sulfurihydrogenibium subterraneum]|uniref:hypothetical protein n=1 Tax=Sulfurihydrogenibium subterraneum TaxID=171121 RepID=UPI00048C68A9|nr:hypothetical protein [Sulfurihydrogenibium subterraneum]
MAVAIISYDVKYIEELTKNMGNTKYEIFGDSLSFIKNFRDDFDTVIYDASSGVFAEDDLRYLTNKMKDKNLKYIVLTVPENPIDKSIFEGNFEILNKNNNIHEIIQNVSKKTEPIESIKEYQENIIESSEYQDQAFEELFQESNLKNTEVVETSSVEVEYNEINLANQDIQSKVVQPIGFEESTLSERLDFEDLLEVNEKDKTFEIEYNTFETTGFNLNDQNKESSEFSLETIEIPQIEEILETKQLELNDENKQINKISLYESELQQTEKMLETSPITDKVKDEQKAKTVSLDELIDLNKHNVEKLTEGGKNMIADFNIQISSEDIKNIALDIAKEYLKNDPAMATIIDHLQIDFQEETRRELEDVKNQLKNKVREEAEKVLTAEIEEIIKKELKDFVAEITAKIVKEKLEQAFKV